MPNPRPNYQTIAPYRFKPQGEKPLSGRLFVRVPPELETAIRSIPNSPAWLRRVIAEAAKRERIGEPQKTNEPENGTLNGNL